MNNCKIPSFYSLIPIKLGCEVRGIDLKVEDREEVIEQIKSDVTKSRLLIFKDQGIVSGKRHAEISKWFGELERVSTIHKHPKSPNLEVLRISNDPEEGCTGIGRIGWHIDGTYHPAPSAYALYQMVSVPKKGPTPFAPLTEVIEGLSIDKRNDWDRIWMVSEGKDGPVHPLIYPHPVTGKYVMCFHLGLTKSYIWDYNTPNERIATDEEFDRINKDIHYEFVKNSEAYQYNHQWEQGDFIVSDNLAVGHEATPETRYPRSEVGLRVLHVTTIKNTYPPAMLKLKNTKSGWD